MRPGEKCGLRSAPAVFQPKRSALLCPVLATAFVALACRSPAPPPPGAKATAATPAAVVAPLPAPPPERVATPPPFAPPEEAPEDQCLVLVRAALAARATRIAEPERGRLAQTLVEAERESGVSACLLVALIEQESRFDPRARGPRGALGLMQIRPFVGKDVAARIGVPWQGEQTLLDPVLNVRIGTAYLSELLDRFGSRELALAAYTTWVPLGWPGASRAAMTGDPPLSLACCGTTRDCSGNSRPPRPGSAARLPA